MFLEVTISHGMIQMFFLHIRITSECLFQNVPTVNTVQLFGVVGYGEGVVYLVSPGRPTDIGLQLGKACYSCSR